MLKKIFVEVVNVHRPGAPTSASKISLLTLKLFVSSVWMARRNADQGNQSYPTRGRLVSCLGLVLLAFVFSSEVLAQTQIVNCDAPVQSRKRGIAVNSNMSALRLGYKQLDRAVWCGDELHPHGLERLFRLSKRHQFLSRGRKQALEGICDQ